MDTAVPSTLRGRFRASSTSLGAMIGFVLGLLLALAEVTTSVPFESNGPSFRVQVLGVVLYRYPEDGDFLGSKGRPVPQWQQARQMTMFGSGLACGAAGWVVGFAFGRRSRAAANRDHIRTEEAQCHGVPPPEDHDPSIEERS